MAKRYDEIERMAPMVASQLRPVDRHLALVLAGLAPTTPTRIPLAQALGLAIAEQVRSSIALPPFANSAMDGYAVRVADVEQLPVTLPVVADLPAGSTSQEPLAAGSAQRIMTGAPVPAGADAVIQVEWTDGGTEHVRIDQVRQPIVLGMNIRARGDDLAPGSVLAEAGDTVDAPQLALLASAGIATVPVFPRARVAVVSTGDELTQPGQPLPPGGIYDSNSYLMSSLVTAGGGSLASRTHITDDAGRARETLVQLAAEADLIVTMGGVSAGAYEVIKDVFAMLGGADFASVAMQPGKPQGIAAIGQTRVIALPGNPLSSLVSFHLFVQPAMRVIGGHRNTMPGRARLRSTVDLATREDRVRYLPATANFVEQTVSTAARQGSHRSSVAVGTNALLEVPMGQVPILAGSPVSVMLLGQ